MDRNTFNTVKRRQVMTACAPCRISHRCCDEPRPCKRCVRLRLPCQSGDTPLTPDLIAEDKRMRIQGRKKKKPALPDVNSPVPIAAAPVELPPAQVMDKPSCDDVKPQPLLPAHRSEPRLLYLTPPILQYIPPMTEQHFSLVASEPRHAPTGFTLQSSTTLQPLPIPTSFSAGDVHFVYSTTSHLQSLPLTQSTSLLVQDFVVTGDPQRAPDCSHPPLQFSEPSGADILFNLSNSLDLDLRNVS